MNKFLRRMLITALISTSLISGSFANDGFWKDISDTQTIDLSYTTEQIKADKARLIDLENQIQALLGKVASKEISKDEFIELSKDLHSESNQLLDKLTKYGLIELNIPDISDKEPIFISSDFVGEAKLDDATKEIFEKLISAKKSIEELEKKYKDHEISQDDYKKLSEELMKKYNEIEGSLSDGLIVVESQEIAFDLTNAKSIDVLSTMDGFTADKLLDIVKNKLSNEEFTTLKNKLSKLENSLKDKSINEDEYSKQLNKLVFETLTSLERKNSLKISKSLNAISGTTIGNDENVVSSKSTLKESIKELDKLLKDGKITKEEYDSKYKYYNNSIEIKSFKITPEDSIKNLEQLFKDGKITQEEYDRKYKFYKSLMEKESSN